MRKEGSFARSWNFINFLYRFIYSFRLQLILLFLFSNFLTLLFFFFLPLTNKEAYIKKTTFISKNSDLDFFTRNYSHPVSSPLHISGSFGEYRRYNRYHYGIDYKTYRRVGLRVVSPSDAWVDKIHISPYGYGNALFLKTEEGTQFTLAHLQDFSCTNQELEYLRKALELLRPRTRVQVKVPSSWFFFAKKQCIAYSGESGAGPAHLHFEIKKGPKYYNPLLFKSLKIPDKSPPSLENLYIRSGESIMRVPLRLCNPSDQCKKNNLREKNLYIPVKDLPTDISRDEKISFLLGGYDTMVPYNKNTIYALNLFIDAPHMPYTERNLYYRQLSKISEKPLNNKKAQHLYELTRTVIGKEYVYKFYDPSGKGIINPSKYLSINNFYSKKRKKLTFLKNGNSLDKEGENVLPFRLCVSDAEENQACAILRLSFKKRKSDTKSAEKRTQETEPRPFHKKNRKYLQYGKPYKGSFSLASSKDRGAKLKIQIPGEDIKIRAYIAILRNKELSKFSTEQKRDLKPRKSFRYPLENIEKNDTAQKKDDYHYEQYGEIFKIDTQNISFIKKIKVSLQFSKTKNFQKNLGLYQFNEHKKYWQLLALPKKKKNYIYYYFRLSQPSLITQLLDISPPKIKPVFLAQRNEEDKEKNRSSYEYRISDVGTSVDVQKTKLLLDGVPIPFQWLYEKSTLKTFIPHRLIAKGGSLLSLSSFDKAGNQSKWEFNFIEKKEKKKRRKNSNKNRNKEQY